MLKRLERLDAGILFPVLGKSRTRGNCSRIKVEVF